MTQGKKKKRAANRSIMLAKKIIIKDGGTVSGARRAPRAHPTPCPRAVAPSSRHPARRGAAVSGPRAPAPRALRPGPACGLRGTVSGRGRRPGLTCRPRPRRPSGPGRDPRAPLPGTGDAGPREPWPRCQGTGSGARPPVHMLLPGTSCGRLSGPGPRSSSR